MLAGVAGGCAEVRAPLPNIVVVLTDDQGWGATSVAMDPGLPESASDFVRTPHLERLAAAGMRFSRAYAAHPNCSPSRAALLTGRSPAALGFTDVPRPAIKYQAFYRGNRLLPPDGPRELDPALITIPELLVAAHPEYRTAHFGKWHLGADGPEAHGFDESDGDTDNAVGSDGAPFSSDPKRCFSVTQRSIDFVRRQVRAGRPFYLQVSHYATHLAYQSRAKSLQQTRGWPGGARHNDAGFAAMSLDLDEALGRLLDALDELSPADRTWVFYTSDNGTYPTGDRANINGPLRGGKTTVFEGGVRVPLVVRGPGVAPGSESAAPVIGTDLLATIADLVGLRELPPGLEGASLGPVLRGTCATVPGRPRDAFCFHLPHYQHRKRTKPTTAWLDLSSGEKLHYRWEDGGLELYDLTTDPGERRGLVGERGARAAELRAQLDAYLTEVGAPLPLENPDFDPALDPALLIPEEELRTYD
jgi:arylsulfatase A